MALKKSKTEKPSESKKGFSQTIITPKSSSKTKENKGGKKKK